MHCRVVSGRQSRSFLGPKLAQKSDLFTLHLYNPPLRSQPDPTQCDHNYCIISYGIAWYCIVGFSQRAVSRKTPIYFMLIIKITMLIMMITWSSQSFLFADQGVVPLLLRSMPHRTHGQRALGCRIAKTAKNLWFSEIAAIFMIQTGIFGVILFGHT